MNRASDSAFPVRSALLLFGSSWGAIVLNYVFHFVLTHHIAIEGYGELSVFIAALSLLTIPSAIISATISKMAAEFTATGDDAQLRALENTAFRLLTILAVVALGVIILGDGAIAEYFNITDPRLVDLFAVIVATNIVGPPLQGMLQGNHAYRIAAFSTLLEPLGKAVLGVAFALAGYGVGGAIVGYALGSVAGVALAVAQFERGAHGAHAMERATLQRMRSFVGAAAVSTAAFAVVSSIDVVLARHFLSPTEAARYSGAALISKFLLFAINVLPPLVLTYVAHDRAKNASGRSTFVVARTIALCISAVGVIAFAAFPTEILAYSIGSGFLPVAPLLAPYGLAMVLLALATLVATYRLAQSDYAFVGPLAIAAVAEVATLSIMHGSALQMLAGVFVGHGFALIASLRRTPKHKRARLANVRPLETLVPIDGRRLVTGHERQRPIDVVAV